MPQIVHEKSKPAKTRAFIARAIGVAVVLAGVALAVFLFIKQQEAQAEERYKAMLVKTETLQSHFKYAEARQVASDYAKTSPTPARRLCEALRRVGGYSLQLKDSSAAISAYTEFYETKGCSKLTAVQGLSTAAIMGNDKPGAIKYLKEEITLWPADAELREAYIKDLQNRVKALGGQP